MKYVIVERLGIEFAIVFPDSVEHIQAVDCAQLKPIAAGFCSVRPQEQPRVQAWGRSTSLKLISRGEDDAGVIEFSLMNMEVLPRQKRILESGAKGGDLRLAVGTEETHPARVAGVTSQAGVATGPLSIQ